MPIYEYACPTCRVRFERLRPMRQSDAPATCPAGHEGAPRVVSRFVAQSSAKPGDDAYDSSYFGEHGAYYHEHDVYSTPPGMGGGDHSHDHPQPHSHGPDPHTQ